MRAFFYMIKKKMQTENDIIISFYKDPKTGLSINNTFRNLLKAGHKLVDVRLMPNAFPIWHIYTISPLFLKQIIDFASQLKNR